MVRRDNLTLLPNVSLKFIYYKKTMKKTNKFITNNLLTIWKIDSQVIKHAPFAAFASTKNLPTNHHPQKNIFNFNKNSDFKSFHKTILPNLSSYINNDTISLNERQLKFENFLQQQYKEWQDSHTNKVFGIDWNNFPGKLRDIIFQFKNELDLYLKNLDSIDLVPKKRTKKSSKLLDNDDGNVLIIVKYLDLNQIFSILVFNYIVMATNYNSDDGYNNTLEVSIKLGKSL